VFLQHQSPVALVVDESYVYFENVGGAILACPVAGCPSEGPTVLTLHGGSWAAGPTLAAGDSAAYFTAFPGDDRIESCRGDGCCLNPSTFVGPAPEGGTYAPIGADPKYLYFGEDTASGSSTLSCPLGDLCTRPQVLEYIAAYYGYPYSGYTTSFATDRGILYVASIGYAPGPYGGFYSVSEIDTNAHDAGFQSLHCSMNPPTVEYGGYASDGVTSMVAAGGSAYIITQLNLGIARCSGTSPYLADEPAVALATDGTSLYWTNYGPKATVATCLVGDTCTSPRTIASDQDYPRYIAVNSSRVYWTTPTEIWSAAK
jgi:hypothetical protein